jgi:eukaryotic-like serine/threonine-protein kinase
VPRTLIDNRYAIVGLLGSGGMAEVYLAHDEVLDRDVALKILRSQYVNDEEFVRLFRREARSAAALNHPSVVPVYYWGRSEDGTYYMAMEHVPGGNLKDRVRHGEPLSADTAAGMILQVADALSFAHERGVIHRDVKPHNILLTEAGYVKVADFGIARAANATTITSRSSPVMGTAGYISPEQAMGAPVGPQSDLYSLGVVLYEALTGDLPYRAEDPVALAMKHVNEHPRSPRQANPEVPESLDALTLKLLAKHPEDRYPSASALAKDLERVRSELPPSTAAPAKAAGETAAPLLPQAPEDETRIMSSRSLLTPEPAENPERGKELWGRLLPILATLLFGSVLLGVLVWVLLRGSGIS